MELKIIQKSIWARQIFYRRYVSSLLGVWQNRRQFDNVEIYCNFIGTPRSGHSIVGSLLNAHPEVVIAHELGVLSYVWMGFSRYQLYSMLLRQDSWFQKSDRKAFGFNYQVPGQWQGRYQTLRVIGDKRGGHASRCIADDPKIIDKLQQTVQVPVHWIHVARNPFDNIATMHLRSHFTLEECCDQYFAMCDVVNKLCESGKHKVLTVCHEEFICSFRDVFPKICAFLQISCPAEYLADCAKVVFQNPSLSREKVDWPESLVTLIGEKLQSYPFLNHYSFS